MIKSTDRICFLGDSITDGIGTDKRYIEYIAEATGAKTYGFGVNGAQSADLFSQLENMKKAVGNDFDILFVLIGTNDFNGGVALGEFFTEHTENVACDSDENGNFTRFAARKKREFIFSDDTFKGRLNKFYSYVRQNYPDKRIIMLTPLHRAYAYFGGDNIQPSELYANRVGNYLEEYVEAERKAADIWAIELIDLYRDCGLFPLYAESASLYFSPDKNDSLHPAANGHALIAKTILNKA